MADAETAVLVKEEVKLEVEDEDYVMSDAISGPSTVSQVKSEELSDNEVIIEDKPDIVSLKEDEKSEDSPMEDDDDDEDEDGAAGGGDGEDDDDDEEEDDGEDDGEKDNMCKVCKKVFESEEELREHYRHPNGPNSMKTFACCACKKTYSKYSYLLLHIPHHTNERLLCKICDKTFRGKRGLRQHKCLNSCSVSFKCSVCKQLMNTFRAYNEHTRNHYEQENFKCADCDYVCEHKYTVRDHVATHLQKRYMDSFQCELCKKYFRHNEMFSHMRRHLDIEASIQCSFCNELFISNNCLLSHLEFVHSQYHCERCLFHTNTIGALLKHKRHIHGVVSKYALTSALVECNLCHFMYNCLETFELHVRNVHADHDPNSIIVHREQIKCSICGLQCKTTSSHNGHMKIHQKAVRCIVCDKGFADERKLLKHSRIHGFVKCDICNKEMEQCAYKDHRLSHNLIALCKVCEAPLNNRGNFWRHAKTKHQEELKTQSTYDLCIEIPFEEYDKKYAGRNDKNWLAHQRRLVRCVECNGQVEYHKMKEHMKRHKLVYVCKVCLARLNTTESFRSHVKRMHKEELSNKRVLDFRKVVKEEELHKSEEIKIEPIDIAYEDE